MFAQQEHSLLTHTIHGTIVYIPYMKTNKNQPFIIGKYTYLRPMNPYGFLGILPTLYLPALPEAFVSVVKMPNWLRDPWG